MATTSKRVLWKGAISFGLVHIPVALHSATVSQSLDFDWLDKRSMDRVGYKRINKATGDDITSENIVKGIQYEDGQYVILSPEEIEAAYPKTTQTVEIEAFVPIDQIPFVYLERPYYMSPINKGAKVYALLREVLRDSRKVGIAKVVIQTKQHLAVLMPCGPALILNLLRWGDEVRSWDELNLPAEGTKAAGLTAKELTMGQQLVDDMSASWKPDDFTDSFKEQIMQLVREKVKAGDTAEVTEPTASEEVSSGATLYDLTEMLRRSLKQGTRTPAKGSRDTSEGKSSAKLAKTDAAAGSAKADGKAGSKTAEKPAAKATTKASTKTAKKAPAKTTSKATKKAASKTTSKTAANRTASKSPAAAKSAAKSTASPATRARKTA